MRSCLILFCGLIILTGCGVSKSSTSPNKKYTLKQLQKDYTLYQEILEAHHPSLYWYTPKDSMDGYFDWGRHQLKDSMTEPEFRKVLSYVTARINCGHTTVRPSRAASRTIDTSNLPKFFPLSIKMWSLKDRQDTMTVTVNLNRRDSILKRGTVITGINGLTQNQIADTLFNFISTDGYNRTHKYQSLSNTGAFGSLYSYIFGLSDKYKIDYIDSSGHPGALTIPIYNPATDTFGRRPIRRITDVVPQMSRKERKQRQLASVRLLQIDTTSRTAMMRLTQFSSGFGLKKFFRRSFKALSKNDINHLIVDVSRNGGGNVTNSTLLTRFLAHDPFKITDSLYAIRKGSQYNKYMKNAFWYKVFMTFISRKRKDGNYHFGYYERHYFKPKKNNHFDGQVYIITGGNSFSATTLFVSDLIKQDNVTVVGEETGGGAYGNSAWFKPDVTLPETGIRFGLPLFRVVIDKDVPKNGRGVQPEVPSVPTTEAIRRGADFKLEKVLELIKNEGHQKR